MTSGILRKRLATSRTFVFFHELEPLFRMGLIKGGDMENAVVILEREVEQEEIDRIATMFNKPGITEHHAGVLNNTKLRFPNEPARHKLLDLIGDLSLVGQPIKGQGGCNAPGPLFKYQACETDTSADQEAGDKEGDTAA